MNLSARFASGENSASPTFAAQLGPEILFPHHAAGLDYRDFTGKPTADFLRAADAQPSPRLDHADEQWPLAGNPDPTTVMLTQIMPESFPRMLRWQFTKVEVRLYSKP